MKLFKILYLVLAFFLILGWIALKITLDVVYFASFIESIFYYILALLTTGLVFIYKFSPRHTLFLAFALTVIAIFLYILVSIDTAELLFRAAFVIWFVGTIQLFFENKHS